MPQNISYNFDIDHYLNPFVPRNRLRRLPYAISYFLGYRRDQERPIGSVLIWFWSCIGAICGVLVVEVIYNTPLIKNKGAPIIIGSLARLSNSCVNDLKADEGTQGASAILKYNTIDSPLAQPRNAILGQLFSSIVGVAIAKLFELSPLFPEIQFVGGALAVGIASAIMGFTKTVHPPAGATALLAVTSPEVTSLGWFLVPLIVLGATLMCAVACVVNNIQRRWPVYWWTPVDLDRLKEERREKTVQDIERDAEQEDNIERTGRDMIMIDGNKIVIPRWVTLGTEEKAVLEVLRTRLEKGLETLNSRGSEATFVNREEVANNTGHDR